MDAWEAASTKKDLKLQTGWYWNRKEYIDEQNEKEKKLAELPSWYREQILADEDLKNKVRFEMD